MLRFTRWTFPVLTLGAVAIASAALAQEPAAKPAMPAAEAAKPDPADRTLREQSIYIPYDKLRQVFEKHGRGVFLPYDKFDELWRAAQDKNRPAAEPRPPVGAVITEIENEATVSGDVVQVKARVKIDLLAEGWQEVPLRLSDAAIARATLGGQPARILGSPGEGHRLLVEKKGKQPEQIELQLEYARAITRSPGQNAVSFDAPQAPVSRWRVRIPQSGVKVNIHPMIAATEVPAGVAAKEPGAKEPAPKEPAEQLAPKPADETVMLAFVGASPTVRIEWNPKAEGATGLAALASVQTEQQVWIQEGMTRVRNNLVYTISRAELAQLTIEVPADYKVVNVVDQNLRQWSVEPAAEGAKVQRVTAQLFEPAKATQSLLVELEKIAGQKSEEKLAIPVVRAMNVGRQQGYVVVQVGSGLRAEAARTSGLMQVDAAELPRTLAGTGWAYAYRYATVPFELELAVEKVQPRITVDSLVEARLEPERLSMHLTAVYTIERSGVFKLELDKPEGFEVRSVRGQEIATGDAAARAAAVEVHAHHLEGEKQNRLVVDLARKALGRVALVVEFQRELQEPNLLTPTGKAADIPLPIPQVAAGAAAQANGRLIVYAPESLRVKQSDPQGMRDVSLKEALDGMPWASTNRWRQEDVVRGQVRPVLSMLFSQQPATLRLSAERRKPFVTIRQMLVARIDEGVVKYQDTLHYSVLYCGVKSLRVDLPEEVAKTLQSTTPGIQDSRIEPQPKDVASGMVAWTFSGNNELLGEGHIELTWQRKIEKLDAGTAADIDIPGLVPQQVDRAWGQLVLAKAETLDLRLPDEPHGLNAIDPQRDLATPVVGGARAYEFHGPWKLPVTVVRNQLEEVKRTSIDRAVVRMVVTPAGEIAVQALYQIRSARQQLAITLPEESAFDTDPLRVNGRSVILLKGDQGSYLVSLAGANPDEPFLLELRYTMPASRSLWAALRFDLPTFPEDPAVQKVVLCVFVPKMQTVLGTTGGWSEEFTWGPGDGGWQPWNRTGDRQWITWVQQGVKDPGTSAETFHTDGVLYTYSTLRPAADSPVVIRTLDHRALSGLLVGIVVLGGLILVPARLPRRLMAMGGFVVLLVGGSVFCPTCTVQLMQPGLLAAIAIVLVIWAIVFALRMRSMATTAGQGAWEMARGAAGRLNSWYAARKKPEPKQPDASQGGPKDE